MNDDLISRKEAIDILENMIFEVGKDLSKSYLLQDARERIIGLNTAFDKEKVIEELKAWEKASYNTGIARAYSGLDNKSSEYYQESRAYHRTIEIVEKGGIV